MMLNKKRNDVVFFGRNNLKDTLAEFFASYVVLSSYELRMTPMNLLID